MWTTETEFHISAAVSFTKIAPDMLVKHLYATYSKY